MTPVTPLLGKRLKKRRYTMQKDENILLFACRILQRWAKVVSLVSLSSILQSYYGLRYDTTWRKWCHSGVIESVLYALPERSDR